MLKATGNLVALILLCGACLWINYTYLRPQIAVDRINITYPPLSNKSDMTEKLRISNSGARTLRINEIKTSCGCTIASTRLKSLGPWQETDLEIKLVNKGKVGPQVRQISIVSNDVKRPVINIYAKYELYDDVLIEPRVLNLGDVNMEDDFQGEYSVLIKEQGVELVAAAVEAPSAGLEVHIEPVRSGRFAVVASGKPTVEGLNSYDIIVSTSFGNEIKRHSLVLLVNGK